MSKVTTTAAEPTGGGTTADATTPQRLMELFAQRAAAGDLDGLVELYEPDAVFQPQAGVTCTGHDEIRAALAELVAIRPRIEYRGVPDVLDTGEVALVSNDWVMTGEAPDGSVVREGGLSADVVRRRPDGTWRVLIDQPRGAPVAS
ncbi:MAG: nuclear transport factor 2 family protein [Actinomycetota bacterium]|nr:nuclear transport factor 2 family protein [Actinomycetota bacterium]